MIRSHQEFTDATIPENGEPVSSQYLVPAKVRTSASLNNLTEEPIILLDNDGKLDGEQILDERSLRSASSGIICGTIDSSQHSGTGSGKSPSFADNLNSKSRQNMMHRLKV